MPNKAATECPWGHATVTPESRTAQGYCRECRRSREREKYRSRREALDDMRALVDLLLREDTVGNRKIAESLSNVVDALVPAA
ncbi:hypothetical protein [Mycobacterium sp. D16Q16]|uniref:hypothetical protein n=1 Tax=Mycobacterium sp. D16Q16 TaxID=1855659 RepID=UPI001115FB85|nr:hypothetical protein [Mycobacterium sp. D16Q16]